MTADWTSSETIERDRCFGLLVPLSLVAIIAWFQSFFHHRQCSQALPEHQCWEHWGEPEVLSPAALHCWRPHASLHWWSHILPWDPLPEGRQWHTLCPADQRQRHCGGHQSGQRCGPSGWNQRRDHHPGWASIHACSAIVWEKYKKQELHGDKMWFYSFQLGIDSCHFMFINDWSFFPACQLLSINIKCVVLSIM